MTRLDLGIHQNFFQMFHWMLAKNKIKYFFEWVGNNLDKTIKIVIKLWWCTSTYVRAVEIDTEFKLVQYSWGLWKSSKNL